MASKSPGSLLSARWRVGEKKEERGGVMDRVTGRFSKRMQGTQGTDPSLAARLLLSAGHSVQPVVAR